MRFIETENKPLKYTCDVEGCTYKTYSPNGVAIHKVRSHKIAKEAQRYKETSFNLTKFLFSFPFHFFSQFERRKLIFCLN